MSVRSELCGWIADELIGLALRIDPQRLTYSFKASNNRTTDSTKSVDNRTADPHNNKEIA